MYRKTNIYQEAIMDYLEDEIALRQNLIDAGCSEKQIEEIMSRISDGEIKICLKKLSNHRNCLLDDLHKSQKCIDCLDYLLYRIEKENK